MTVRLPERIRETLPGSTLGPTLALFAAVCAEADDGMQICLLDFARICSVSIPVRKEGKSIDVVK